MTINSLVVKKTRLWIGSHNKKEKKEKTHRIIHMNFLSIT